MELVCPKCRGSMRQYERGGVVVDQCTDCRGIFLDRGELERLVDSENGWYERSEREPRYSERPRVPTGGGESGYAPRKPKKSFLSELFD